MALRRESRLPGDPRPATDQRPSNQFSEREQRYMDQLWTRMQTIYSGLWRSVNNSSTDIRYVAQREWLGGIRKAGLTWNQVIETVDRCAVGDKASPGMPPNLPEFITLSRPPEPPKTPLAAHQPFPHLPEPAPSNTRRDAARAELDKMRDMLK
jgi:hypothetical protein